MILTCPNCGTQYVVKDGAIPPEGRQVRCAACKHSWHQGPEALAAAPEQGFAEGETTIAEPASSVEQPPEEESLAEATLVDHRSGPEAEERAYEGSVIEGDTDIPDSEAASAGAQAPEARLAEAAESESAEPSPNDADWKEPPHAEPVSDMFSPFADNGETEPRRRSPLVSVVLIILLVIVAAAGFWFLASPDLKARFGLAANDTSPLALVVTHKDRQQLESGNQLLTITGRVINPTTREQVIPPLQAQLLGPGGRVVYSWTIDPPARSLPAGGSTSFNSAEVNVPPGGNDVRISLTRPKV